MAAKRKTTLKDYS